MRFVFEDFSLDTKLFELRRGGVLLPLQPKPVDLLRYLIEHRDRVVMKKELLSSVWTDVCVTENALRQAVGALRDALAGTASPAILAVRGRGYRFALPVKEMLGHSTQPPGPAKRGFVAAAGMNLADLAGGADDARGVRTVRTHARAAGPLSSFRALLTAYADAFPEDTVHGLPLARALTIIDGELAFAELVTEFMAAEKCEPTIMILEGLENADLASLLLFCHLAEQPRGAVTLVGTSNLDALRPRGLIARLLEPHLETDDGEPQRERGAEGAAPDRLIPSGW